MLFADSEAGARGPVANLLDVDVAVVVELVVVQKRLHLLWGDGCHGRTL